jgi:tetratricopeptide (TPR) repeat protein
MLRLVWALLFSSLWGPPVQAALCLHDASCACALPDLPWPFLSRPEHLRLFESTSKAHPEDSELQLALGVLHHLNRRYDAAIAAFQRALELRPGDYRCVDAVGQSGQSGILIFLGLVPRTFAPAANRVLLLCVNTVIVCCVRCCIDLDDWVYVWCFALPERG